MKRTTKSWLAVLLTVLLLFSTVAFGFSAAAEGESTVFASGYCGGEGDGTNLSWTFDGGTLTISGTGAMKKPEGWGRNVIEDENLYQTVTAIVIEDGVTTISDHAFQSYRKVESVSIGNSVTRIGSESFLGNLITELTIPDSVTEIGANAFSGCRSLQSVHIGNGVESIGEMAFYLCDALTELELSENLKVIGKQAFFVCRALPAVTIPDSVERIEIGAFQECTALENVTFGSGLAWIGDNAFFKCEKLADVTLPNARTVVDGPAFQSTMYSNSPQNWENGALYFNTSLSQVQKDYAGVFEVRPGTTHVGSVAFASCSEITAITLPESVGTIGEAAFTGCRSLTDINLPDGLTVISSYMFDDCESLKNLDIPDSVTEIEDGAFSGCGFESFCFPDGIPTVGLYVLGYCMNLKSVTIPDSVTTIKGDAFYACTALETVSIGSGVTKIGYLAFAHCVALKSITIPDNVKELEWDLFNGCTALEQVRLPKDIKTIPGNMFRYCTGLQTFTIPDGVTTISKEAFYDCSSLREVTIPESVTMIGENAFYGCENLTDVVFTGTRSQWNQIEIDRDNNPLLGAKKHFATEEEDSNITWTLEDGVLTVSGTGLIQPTMEWSLDQHTYWTSAQTWQTSSYLKQEDHYPWDELREDAERIGVLGEKVNTIIIEEGITGIIGHAFGAFMPKTIMLPSTLTTIPKEFTHPNNPTVRYIVGSPFNMSRLCDLYIGNAQLDFTDVALDLVGYAADTLPTATWEGMNEELVRFAEAYLNYTNDVWVEGASYFEAKEFLYAISDTLEPIYAAQHGVWADNIKVLEGHMDDFLETFLELKRESWEKLGITYTDLDSLLEAIFARLNNQFGTSFSSLDELFVVTDPDAVGTWPLILDPVTAFSDEMKAVEIAVDEMAAPMNAIVSTFEEEWFTEKVTSNSWMDYPLGQAPQAEKDGETFDLLPLPWLTIHGYADSTAEAAAAASGVRFVPITAAGTCGEHLTWVLENNTLTVSGTGAMADYSESEPAPWMAYFAAPGASITVVLEEGIASIGANAFPASDGLKELIVLNRDCDLSALVIREPAFLRGYRPSTAEDYGNAHEDESLFMPLCNKDYHHAIVWKVERNDAEEPDGHIQGVFCTVCDDYIYARRFEHDWSDWVTTKQPTAEEEGEETRTCSVCEKTEERSIEKLQPAETNETNENNDNNNNNNNDGNNKKGSFWDTLKKAGAGIVRWFKKLLSFFNKK